MKTHFQQIYANNADRYDALVRREDHKGNLLRAIEAHAPLKGADVVELGMGTGRLTGLMVDKVKSLHGYDQSEAMLSVARSRLKNLADNWTVAVAEHRSIPLPDGCADLVIEGWAFGHLVEDAPEPWLSPARDAIAEMQRLLRPGGVMMLIETLGTGATEPRAPHERLEGLYEMLERELGFTRAWVRTDYRFESEREAAELVGFFFGEAMLARLNDGVELAECTGLWWRSRPGQ